MLHFAYVVGHAYAYMNALICEYMYACANSNRKTGLVALFVITLEARQPRPDRASQTLPVPFEDPFQRTHGRAASTAARKMLSAFLGCSCAPLRPRERWLHRTRRTEAAAQWHAAASGRSRAASETGAWRRRGEAEVHFLGGRLR